MGDQVLTHATEPRGMRMCQCAVCGGVERCTPASDFFTLDGEDDEPLENGKPLVCSRCFYQKCAVKLSGGLS